MTANQPGAAQPANGVVPRPPSPDPELIQRAQRRQFPASYKLRILEEADACKDGEVGALLRREALYSSHPSCLRGALTAWRRQRTQGLLSAFASRRGRPPKDPATAELARLRLENERLTRKLAVAETIIDVQKKVAALLGITAGSPEQGGKS